MRRPQNRLLLPFHMLRHRHPRNRHQKMNQRQQSSILLRWPILPRPQSPLAGSD